MIKMHEKSHAGRLEICVLRPRLLATANGPTFFRPIQTTTGNVDFHLGEHPWTRDIAHILPIPGVTGRCHAESPAARPACGARCSPQITKDPRSSGKGTVMGARPAAEERDGHSEETKSRGSCESTDRLGGRRSGAATRCRHASDKVRYPEHKRDTVGRQRPQEETDDSPGRGRSGGGGQG